MADAFPLRVLVVDDEPLIRWSMTETLGQSGYIVSEAADGESALRALEIQPPPDVVLLDLRLPDSNGLALLARIRQRVPAAAVVMMTAFGSPEMTADAEGLGVYKVIGKPIDMRELDRIVRAASAARPGPSVSATAAIVAAAACLGRDTAAARGTHSIWGLAVAGRTSELDEFSRRGSRIASSPECRQLEA